MHNKVIASIDRRGFLRMGTLLGLLGAAGCDSGGDSVGKPTGPPPAQGGNRNKLEKMKVKAAEAAGKKK
jgi:hypothetical protein